MDFRTKIPFQRQKQGFIDYNSKLLLLGSCFVEHIGNKLAYCKFQLLQNPFGILFHPLAIESLISSAINNRKFSEEDVFFYNEQWHYFNAHSKLSASSKDELLETLNQQSILTQHWLQKASHIMITLGTAWVYRHISTDTIVSNCHKVPQKQFLKELLSVDTITESLEAILALIKDSNSKAQVIFTVSPVRHLKDGFVENALSKAHLIAAVHQVVDKRKVHYFPSYELMMDELRDYRFYAPDMIHPNEIAVNYIWKQFQSVWLSDDAIPTMKTIIEIEKGLQHKPFNPNSKAHQTFLDKLNAKKNAIVKDFPHISFAK